MWELDWEESWAPKNWCFWTVVLEKTLESPLDCKEIQSVHPKEDQSWVFIGRTDVEAETPILWPPDAKSWLIWKDSDSGKDWGQGEKGMTEDELVGWHHQLNGHGVWVNSGSGDGQGGLACGGPWSRKESDTTEQLYWKTDRSHVFISFVTFDAQKNLMMWELAASFYTRGDWASERQMTLWMSIVNTGPASRTYLVLCCFKPWFLQIHHPGFSGF